MTLLQQTSFMNSAKQELKETEFTIQSDFSENLSLVVKDEVQNFLWSNEQVTIHSLWYILKKKKKKKSSTQFM